MDMTIHWAVWSVIKMILIWPLCTYLTQSQIHSTFDVDEVQNAQLLIKCLM